MKTRVLVVDDEHDTLNLLKTILEISGFDPVTTINSTDAMTLAEIEKPDVALLDIMMPKLDGFTLCKMMRQHEATKHLPIIFVTAYPALDLEERRIEAGADYVLHKPINMDALVEAIIDMYEKRKQELRAKAAFPTPSSSLSVSTSETKTATGSSLAQTERTPASNVKPTAPTGIQTRPLSPSVLEKRSTTEIKSGDSKSPAPEQSTDKNRKES